MIRPLIVTDCDEVLLHMVVPFRDWLDETHNVHFDFATGDFATALRHKLDGSALDHKEIWPLLDGFFETEMRRQMPLPGAVDALAELAEHADVVVLTNLPDYRQIARAEHLAELAMAYPVHTNQGGKGRALAEIVAAHTPSLTIFIDDLASNHLSVGEKAPDVWRLQMVGEPGMAPYIPDTGHAHARIDSWAEAMVWIRARIAAGEAAPVEPLASDAV